jgi:hypothetical protein
MSQLQNLLQEIQNAKSFTLVYRMEFYISDVKSFTKKEHAFGTLF